MSTYKCDICSAIVSKTEVEFLTSARMHQAIRRGLNPWKTPGIDMSASANMARAFGQSPETLYQGWRQRAMADTTDWGLCPVCAGAVGPLTRTAPTPSVSPVSPAGNGWKKRLQKLFQKK